MPKNKHIAQTAVHALIVAAGTGSRYGGAVPKQYQLIAAKPLLVHTLARLAVDEIGDVTLVLSKTDTRADELMSEFEAAIGRSIRCAVGGDERWQSVANGVAAISAAGAHDSDWVLIHDAARPCLPKMDLLALIDRLNTLDAAVFADALSAKIQAVDIANYSAAILATPVVDTLKQVIDGQISHTVSRDGLWQALTPQAFRLGQLKMVLAWVANTGKQITDEASAFEMMGLPVAIVTGSRMNMKLTYAEDLALITLILQQFFDKDDENGSIKDGFI